MSDFSHIIFGHVDKDFLTAEVWWKDDEMLAEVYPDGNQFSVTLYPRISEEPWTFKLSDLSEALKEARSSLLERGYEDSEA